MFYRIKPKNLVFQAYLTIVLAAGTQPNDELEAALRAMSVEFYKIGDCAKSRKAIDAIHEGFKAAMKI